MKNTPKFLAIILFGLVLIAGAAYFGYTRWTYFYRHWYVPAHWYTKRFPWHQIEITRVDFVRMPVPHSAGMPLWKDDLRFWARHPAEDEADHEYWLNSEYRPTITLDGQAISYEDLYTALAKPRVEVNDAGRMPPLSYAHRWFNGKKVYVRRNGCQVLAIRILTDERP